MPRQARIVIPNTAHHITQRGNYQQNIFDREDNYQRYCKWMNEYAQDYNVDILGWCLMSNHVHFVVIPKKKDSLAKLFNTVHMRYSQYFNRERGLKGHLWQARFYSCILDDQHLYRTIRYVENNPVRAKMVKEVWRYKWSSAADHVEERNKPLIKLRKYKTIDKEEWKEYLKEADSDMNREIRLKTDRGLVVGTEKFIKKLEVVLNRSLKCLKQGRPKRSEE